MLLHSFRKDGLDELLGTIHNYNVLYLLLILCCTYLSTGVQYDACGRWYHCPCVNISICSAESYPYICLHCIKDAVLIVNTLATQLSKLYRTFAPKHPRLTSPFTRNTNSQLFQGAGIMPLTVPLPSFFLLLYLPNSYHPFHSPTLISLQLFPTLTFRFGQPPPSSHSKALTHSFSLLHPSSFFPYFPTLSQPTSASPVYPSPSPRGSLPPPPPTIHSHLHNSSTPDPAPSSATPSTLSAKDLNLNSTLMVEVYFLNLMNLLQYLLYNYSPQIMAIVETWLFPYISDLEIALPTYCLYRSNCNRHGGGISSRAFLLPRT